MHFGQTLAKSVYPPWKDHYIDYAKLKRLLREDGPRDAEQSWTEDDETNFCDELLNTQLSRVADFQDSTLQELEQRAAKVGEKLQDLAPEEEKEKETPVEEFRKAEDELEHITDEVNQLKRYSALNYTGLLKAAKKKDRIRGKIYTLRPMLQISLAKRPFNSEQTYTPLLNKLSMMYYVVRQNLEKRGERKASTVEHKQSLPAAEADKYTGHKFWIHPDNLLEVKTYILRRLPVLVFAPQSAQQIDVSRNDPTITSLYFDNHQFSLYGQKVDPQTNASSLRIRWYGDLLDKPELSFEQKTVGEDGFSEEKRFSIKNKSVQPFLNGDYNVEKQVQRMEKMGQPAEKIAEYQRSVKEIQQFVKENNLGPMMRATYTRTAFQNPSDDRVRISCDTRLAFIREDTLDPDRPCRDSNEWHRNDIDNNRMEYPFSNLDEAEISRFPYAVMEIKVKEDAGRKAPQWIQDLMASHLVHKVPRFSKFAHGEASLFEDNVNILPYWISEMETNIQKDPQEAFEEEEQAKAQKAQDRALMGSFQGSSGNKRSSYKPAVSSPVGKSYMTERLASEAPTTPGETGDVKGKGKAEDTVGHDGPVRSGGYGTISSVFPSFSLSKYAQSRRRRTVDLPPGVTEPDVLLKDSGPLQVEPKVWLANERTFLKWQHICVLLGALALSLYTAAGKDKIAEYMGLAYIIIAIFAGGWGYYMHLVRRDMIVARSGKDFDNFIGPLVVSFALMIALVLNFIFKFRDAIQRTKEPPSADGMLFQSSAL